MSNTSKTNRRKIFTTLAITLIILPVRAWADGCTEAQAYDRMLDFNRALNPK